LRIALLNWRDIEHSASGGAELFVQEVTRRWGDQGHQVSMVSSQSRGLPRRHLDQNVEVWRVGRLSTGTHHLRALHFVRTVIRPDVILESINTFPYQILRGESRVPIVSLVHQMAVDVWDAHFPYPVAALARWAEPHFYRAYRNARVLAVSPSTAADLRATGIGQVEVIPQGGVGKQDLFPKETTPTVLFVGRLAPNKRPEHALAAFSLLKERVPEARMWIVGTGPMIGQLSTSLPAGVQLLGRLDRTHLLERMSRAHLLFVTSVREGWGLAVTEANAMGTPAVAYRVPGLKDAVKDGETGFLTEVQPSALADRALSILGDKERYARIRENATLWGSSFTWDRTATTILGALERSVETASVRSPALR
jgi:glycosyltransferase involved in cell wall biosynthesis